MEGTRAGIPPGPFRLVSFQTIQAWANEEDPLAECAPCASLAPALGTDDRILCHDLESGKTLLHRKLAGTPHGKAAAPDRRHLAIANSDGTIFLFRLAAATGR